MVKKESKKSTRTDEDKILQVGATVILGGQKYLVLPLAIKYSWPWCSKVVDLLKDVPKYSTISSDDPEAFSEGFKALMVGKPKEIVDLFFEYAKDLKREEIEEKASSAEVVAAFEEVLKLESPLLGATTRAVEAVSR